MANHENENSIVPAGSNRKKRVSPEDVYGKPDQTPDFPWGIGSTDMENADQGGRRGLTGSWGRRQTVVHEDNEEEAPIFVTNTTVGASLSLRPDTFLVSETNSQIITQGGHVRRSASETTISGITRQVRTKWDGLFHRERVIVEKDFLPQARAFAVAGQYAEPDQKQDEEGSSRQSILGRLLSGLTGH